MVFFSDLDRTLIYSKRSIGEDGDYTIVETIDGKEISFMTKEAVSLLEQIRSKTHFIPVTTRTLEQILRLSFIKENIPKYIVANNGASIYVNGQKDLTWDKLIHRKMQRNHCNIEQVYGFVTSVIQPCMIKKIKTIENMYMEIKLIEVNETTKVIIKNLSEQLRMYHYIVYLNSDKLYIVPHFINKQSAVLYLIFTKMFNKTISAGDSLMDLNMLYETDIAIAPKHKTFKEDFMIVTKEKGIKAGEEILKIVNSFDFRQA